MDGPQWLEERRKLIGGSDVAAIMGMNPWKTAYRVYQEKRKEVEDWQGNEATDWGKRLEPALRQWYSDVSGRPVRLPDKIIVSGKYPFMGASLDGYTDDGRIVEIKTARNGRGWGNPGTNEIPDCYVLQVQHYMIVTGFEVTDIPVSIAGGPPELYEVPADRELQEMIIEVCANFWRRVQEGNPPDPVTYADAVARYGKSNAEGSVIASEGALAGVAELKHLIAQRKELEAVEEDVKGRIIRFLGDTADTLVDSAGNTLVTYKLANGRKSFDAKAFEKDHPNLYLKYIKTSEPQRRFLVK